ncbi:MAG: GntR family transcriptional regulator [Oscillospiraceae bacterium]|nr:GntR family transcriptional regulator [Oscillospiraceae bacterium]
MGDFIPLYQQVADRLRKKIRSGVYKYGDKLPSEKELAAHYGVNRMTVRRAVALLAEEGILKTIQGKGIYVTNLFFQVKMSQDGLLFSKDFFGDPRLHQEILFLEQMPAGKTMGEVFRIGASDPVWLCGRRWMAGSMAIALDISFVPTRLLPDLTAESCGQKQFQQLFREAGIPQTRREQTIKSITVYGQEAELLQMKEGENALLVKLMAQDENRNTCRFAKIIVQSHSVLHYMKGIV